MLKVTCPAHTHTGWVTLVAVKKMSTASGTMMIPMVLNCRARKASAPSWTALAMSTMEAVPESVASTPRTRRSATTMAAKAQTNARYSQVFSLPEKTKAWYPPSARRWVIGEAPFGVLRGWNDHCPLLRPRLTALKDAVPLRVTAGWPDAGARRAGTPFPATGAEDTDK